MKAKVLSLLLVITVLCLLVPAFAKDMPDVPFTHWAYDAVDELTDIGILQGYPDGTYGGQRTLTRYEFAEATVKLLHYLENYVDEKTAALEAGVDAAAARAIARDEAAKAVSGLKLPTFDMTLDQVKQVAAAAGAQAAKDALAGMSPGVTKADAQAMIDAAVRNLVTQDYVNGLVTEFRRDLQQLGVDVDDLMYRVDQLEARLAALDGRVAALENKPDKVTGEIKWRAGSAELYDSQWAEEIVVAPSRGFFPYGWERFSNMDVKLNVDGFISKNVPAHIQIWRPDATYDWDNRGTYIHEAWLEFDNNWLGDTHIRMGQQFHKSLCGLMFDNDLYPLESAKANFDFGDVDLTAMWGTIYDNNDPIGYGRLGWQVSSRLNVGASYVPNAVDSEERWGLDTEYTGMSIPFFGLKADACFEFAELQKDVNDYEPDDENQALLARLGLYKGDKEPGDACLTLSWGQAQENYIPQLTSIQPYNWFVEYSGLNWDYLLFNDAMPIAGSQIWAAEFTKSFGDADVLLGWRQYNPWDNSSVQLTPGGPAQTDNVNIYQLQLTHPLTEGVDATFTYARADFDMFDDTRDYFSGSIDVQF